MRATAGDRLFLPLLVEGPVVACPQGGRPGPRVRRRRRAQGVGRAVVALALEARPAGERAMRAAASAPARLVTRLTTAFRGPVNRRSYRIWGALLLIVFSPVALLQLTLGAAPITGPWDVMALLDGGWRIVSGQVPHAEVHNPIGPLTYELIALGMKVGRPSTSSIVYGTVLLMAALMPWAWRIAAVRLPAPIAFVWGLTLGFLLISPRPLGYAIRETTYAMMYNRAGYVFLAMFLLCLFLPRREPTPGSIVIDGFALGLLAALMFYNKITYAAAAFGSLLLGVLLDRRPASWFAATGLGFLTGGALFFAVFHVNPQAYIADILSAGHVQSVGERVRLLMAGVENNFWWLYLIAVCLACWTRLDLDRDPPGVPGFKPWLITAWILAAGLAISTGNAAQRGGVDDPLFFVAGIIAIEWYCRCCPRPAPRAAEPFRLVHGLSLAIVVPIFCGTILARDVAAVAYASAWDIMRRPTIDASRRLHSPALRDFLVPAGTNHITAYWPARDHSARINEGIDLLRKHLEPDDRITALAFTNPFSLALGVLPAHDALQWWELNHSFNHRSHPSAEQVLGDATLVIVPQLSTRDRGLSFETVDAMLDLYGDYLNAHFQQIDSTPTWKLYRRKA